MARGSKAPSERRRHGKMYVPFYSTVLHVEVFRMYNKVHLEACRYLPGMYDASLRALPAVVCTVGSVLSVTVFTQCKFTMRPMLAESGVVSASV